ncbi:MAG: hypothetical protein ACI3W5_07965 [Faecousia sp.]
MPLEAAAKPDCVIIEEDNLTELVLEKTLEQEIEIPNQVEEHIQQTCA